jgi:hypothetical protein
MLAEELLPICTEEEKEEKVSGRFLCDIFFMCC